VKLQSQGTVASPKSRAVPWLWSFTAAATVLAGLAVALAGGGALAYGGAAALGAHMASQTHRLDIHDTARCLALFRETRFGGIAFAALLMLDATLRA
ncbi:MAG: hypothetical protein AAFV49_06720, partial [Pseudomonadota bacterium]